MVSKPAEQLKFGALRESIYTSCTLQLKLFALFADMMTTTTIHRHVVVNEDCMTCLQVGISEKTTVDWFKYLREVCSNELMANPVHVGGPGRVVTMDQSVVARKKLGNVQG